MRILLADFRLALRGLRRSPWLTLVGILSLGLALGSTTAIFNLVNAVLLRPLPVPDPHSLVEIYRTDEALVDYGPSSYPDYELYRDHNETLAALAAYSHEPIVVASDHGSDRVWAGVVSPNYFEVLGLRPAAGRFFGADDGRAESALGAVLGYRYWQTRFGGDREIIGQTIRLDERSTATILGVAPPGFTGTILEYSLDLWIPIQEGNPRASAEGGSWLTLLLGRLRDGASVARARQDLRSIATGLANSEDRFREGQTVHVVPAQLVAVPLAREWSYTFYGLLLLTAVLVLLVACNNLAGILLAHAFVRRSETAVLQSLGATRGSIRRRFFLESLILALVGGGVAVLLAFWARRTIHSLMPFWEAPLALDLGFDTRTWLFLGIALLGCGLLMGIAPALAGVVGNLSQGLRQGAGGVNSGQLRLRKALVISQIPLSLLLLIVAGLLLRTTHAAHQVDLGFAPQGILTAQLEMRLQELPEEEGQQFYRELVERVQALPGVEAASIARGYPFGSNLGRIAVAIEGRQVPEGEPDRATFNVVDGSYLKTLGIPLREGRFLLPRDTPDSIPVVVVDEVMAERFWPGQNAIGQRMRIGSREEIFEVVGVVAATKMRELQETAEPALYVSIHQFYRPNMNLVLRTASPDPAGYAALLRQNASEIRSSITLYNVRPLDEYVYWVLWQQRMIGFFVGLFAAVSLILAVLGLYGVISYLTLRRRQEIAVRMSLGANRGDILRLVLRQAFELTAIGLFIGLGAAVAVATFLIRDFLFEVSPFDPLVFGGVTVLITVLALLAAFLPAYRAAGVHPMVGLRSE